MHSMFEEQYSEKVDLKLWREILKFAKPFRRELLILILVVMGVALIDAIFPYMSKIAIDQFVVPQRTEGLGWFLAGFMVVVALQALNIYVFIAATARQKRGSLTRSANTGLSASRNSPSPFTTIRQWAGSWLA